MATCADCGTKLDGGVCPNCHEELYIFETQISVDGTDVPLSNEFVNKIQEQRVKVEG